MIVEGKDISTLPPLFGVKTGTKLDYMFYTVEVDEEGKAHKRVLGGIPYLSVMNVVGIPDSGKSVLAEQFAITQSNMGYRVLFITTETPVEFVLLNIRSRSNALGYSFDEVKKNMFFIDLHKDDELRENVKEVKSLMKEVIESKKTTITIIDSITGLYESDELKARKVVREIFNFLKDEKQTSFIVSQKRSYQHGETAESAGGLAVAHIVDGTIVLDKKVIMTKYESSLFNIPIGGILRTIRIDGCRVSGHDVNTYKVEITPLGIFEIKEPLSLRLSKDL